jgi:NAD(P)-dependent dehydrogenase (short-subunit alcohol dehydrogenase family)
MVKSFAAELRPVRVNGVCAGAVDTQLWYRLQALRRCDAERERAAAAVKTWLLAEIDKKRAAPASDIVEPALDEPFARERLAAQWRPLVGSKSTGRPPGK